MDLIPITLKKIKHTKTYTCITLGPPEKSFAIYTESSVGLLLKETLTKTQPQRPQTHNLLLHSIQALQGKVLQSIIHDFDSGTYFGRLFLEQQLATQSHFLEIDCRPSDCILLSIATQTPLFCSPNVLEKSVLIHE